MKKDLVLISGGSGLIGQEISRYFENKGFEVNVLTRNKSKSRLNGFAFWNPNNKQIDLEAFKQATIFINLAGASISKRWTKPYKKEIVKSRVEPLAFIAEQCEMHQKTFKKIICASAIGVYPQTTDSKLVFDENGEHGKSFLSKTVVIWEKANKELEKYGSLCQIRIGLVLSHNGGAWPILKKMHLFGLGSKLGLGEQGYSWIHLHDLVRIFYALAVGEKEGVFNAVAPNVVSQWEMSKVLAKKIKRPLILPPVPKFILRLILGEQASLLTHGAYVSNEKLLKLPFEFVYPDLKNAIQNLLDKT